MKVFNVEFQHRCALFVAIVVALCGPISAIVTNNFVDPVPVFSVKGSSISLLSKKLGNESANISVNFSPYTQIIKSCYKADGTESARLGDRVGHWGMGAMARDIIANPGASSSAWVPVLGDPTTFPLFWAQAKDKVASLNTVNFIQQTDLFYSVDFDYEKVGMRAEVAFEPAEGFVCSLQGGICDHKTSAPRYWNPVTSAAYLETSGAESADPTMAAFMWATRRETYFAELGLDVSGYQNVELDDFTAQVAFSYPLIFKDDPKAAVRLVPRATVGLIIPSDEIMKKKKVSPLKDNVVQGLVPVGNDGFTGLLMEGAVCLDFQDTINFTVAGGYTIFKERSITGYRLPNNKYQAILYPFKQDISKKRGGTWHLGASMFAEEFIQGMQCFVDYSWTVHRRDKITLDDATKLPLFKDGIEAESRRSEFRVGTAHLGLSYKIAKHIEAGFAMQGALHGSQVFKPYTFMGSLFIVF